MLLDFDYLNFFLVIQNPAPGVMTYETPLPYSATDPDNAICPIPLIERPGYSSTNRYLDREVRLNNKQKKMKLFCFHRMLFKERWHGKI